MEIVSRDSTERSSFDREGKKSRVRRGGVSEEIHKRGRIVQMAKLCSLLFPESWLQRCYLDLDLNHVLCYWAVAYFCLESVQVHVTSNGREGGVTEWEATGKGLDGQFSIACKSICMYM